MCDEIDVVIPARNTRWTIGPIVEAFKSHPAIGRVIVVVDWDTVDLTAKYARHADIMLHDSSLVGKGQCVSAGVECVTTPWVIFCDSDIKGLTQDHISLLIGDAVLDRERMTIGVPDVPKNYPTNRLWAWSWVSGERCIPTRLVRPMQLHGYLMETQINRAAKYAGMALNFEWLTGLKSEYKMTEQRLKEMERDAAWGRAHGLL